MMKLMLAGIVSLGLAVPAQAAFNSAYTDINLDQCLVLDSDDFGSSWSCPGYKGYPLMVTESDLRFGLAYGFNLDKEVGAQSVPPFNTLGPKIEWRLSNALARWMPIATIVRYHTADPETGEDSGQVLVVTQLVEGNICQIAYIDAVANADANDLARQAADTSGDFNCPSDEPEKIGKFTAW